MKKARILVAVLACALFMTACGTTATPDESSVPESSQESSQSGVAVNVSDEGTPENAVTGLVINANGVLIVADGSPDSEEISEGVSIAYGQDISISVAENGAVFVAEHALSTAQADALIEKHKSNAIEYDDILVETKGIQPLFHNGKSTALTNGHGYYFVDNDKILFVGFNNRETNLVTYLGQYSGAKITLSDDGSIDVKAGNTVVQVDTNGGVSVNAGGGVSVTTDDKGNTSVNAGEGVNVTTDDKGNTTVNAGEGTGVSTDDKGNTSVNAGGTKVETSDDGSVNIDLGGGSGISVGSDGSVKFS